jgi:TolB-like protein
MKKLSMALSLAALMLSACANQPEQSSVEVEEDINPYVKSLGNAELFTHRLAEELFVQTLPLRPAKYAVVGFVPIPGQAFQPEHHHPLQLLGHQLKEGLITEAAKRGYATQEFLLTDDITVTDFADAVLSRNVDLLGKVHDVDFFITGTILHQERGAMVNARIVHAHTREIVAAATSFFPAELFWQSERLTTRNGRLIRQQNNNSSQ